LAFDVSEQFVDLQVLNFLEQLLQDEFFMLLWFLFNGLSQHTATTSHVWYMC